MTTITTPEQGGSVMRKTSATAALWIATLFLMLYLPTRTRVRKVMRSGDRGGGGGSSVETVLLVIAGIVVAGIVIGVILSRVNSEKGKVTGGGGDGGLGNT